MAGEIPLTTAYIGNYSEAILNPSETTALLTTCALEHPHRAVSSCAGLEWPLEHEWRLEVKVQGGTLEPK